MGKQFPRVVTARVRITVECPECAYPVPVNGVVATVLCHTCQSVVKLAGEYAWNRILQYAKREPVRTQSEGLLMSPESKPVLDNFLVGPHRIRRQFEGMLVEIDERPIACIECRTELPLDTLLELAQQRASRVHCPNCAAATSLRTEPALGRYFTSRFAQLLAVVGETAPVGELAEDNAAKPVLFSCLGCGAPLKVDASASRLLTCEYCGATSYLPDALWLRLHPAARKCAFFLILHQTAPASL